MENKKFSFYATLTEQELITELTTSAQGLEQMQAQQQLKKWGPNTLPEEITTWWDIIKNQISNPFIYLLGIVALIYVFTHQPTEALIIFIIIIINSSIGFYQEYQSNQAMKFLKQYLQNSILTKRSGQNKQIPINELVPGDLIILNAGDIIPADCRFITAENILIDESTLTGESLPTKKNNTPLTTPITTPYDAHNIGFAGTIVIDGTAVAIIFATGTATLLGNIAGLTTQAMSKSKLTQGTMQLAHTILLLILISLIIIFLINIFIKQEQTSWIHLGLFSAALAITAIPTALPLVITFCLTQGAKKLHAHKIIIKRLSSIEDLGGIEVLCTDKTGTLTENSLRVKNIYQDDQQTVFNAALSSTVIMNKTENIPKGFDLAIIEKLTAEEIRQLNEYTIIKELPFTYERHRSITIAHNNNDSLLITKGPTEYIIPLCPFLTQEQLTSIKTWVQENESASHRVLAIATKKINSINHEATETHDNAYDTIGLISFSDPLKQSAAQAIKTAQTIGVQIKVLSGDSADVCYTIAEQLGLESNKENVILGKTFEESTEEEKIFLVQNRTIFARVTPEQKYLIITYLQKTYSVGYMGDGINDAPALKIANVGIAVNDATPVAREAAEIILLQKNLLNVMLGIEEGRTIVINTLKYIKITIASNFGNFYSLAISSLFINYLPMLPLQLLFLDLATDLPLIAISTDTVNKKELKKPLHYNPKEISFVTLIFGLVSSPFDFIVFTLFKDNPATLQTSWFIASSLTQLALIFSLRTQLPFWKAKRPSLPLLSLCIISTTIIIWLPFTSLGHEFLFFSTPTMTDMIWIISIVISYFITTEIVKLIYYHTYLNQNHKH